MKFDTAWLHYRSNRKIAKAARVSDQAVSLWKAKGVVPLRSAELLEVESGGAVKVDRSLYDNVPRAMS